MAEFTMSQRIQASPEAVFDAPAFVAMVLDGWLDISGGTAREPAWRDSTAGDSNDSRCAGHGGTRDFRADATGRNGFTDGSRCRIATRRLAHRFGTSGHGR